MPIYQTLFFNSKIHFKHENHHEWEFDDTSDFCTHIPFIHEPYFFKTENYLVHEN